MADVVVRLPDHLRGELKDPLGDVYTDAGALLAAHGEGPIVAVGDMVTYHLLRAGRRPDVALIDGKTEREAVDREITDAIDGFDHHVTVANPAATLTDDLLAALADAFRWTGAVLVTVEGEEDLAALPAVLAAPDGAAVVYGQPGEGMVLATVDAELRVACRELLGRMDGDLGRLADALDV